MCTATMEMVFICSYGAVAASEFTFTDSYTGYLSF